MKIALLEKIKTDKKARNTVFCAGVSALIVIAAAVAIPIGVHAQGVKKAAAAQEAASVRESLAAEQAAVETQTTEALTEAPTETIPETTATAAVTENTTAKKSASGNSGSSGSAKKSTSASKSGNTGSKSSSGSKSSGSKSSGSKGGAAAAKTTFPSHDWPKAKVDAIIAEARAYGESLGLVWYEDWSKEDGSWSFPAMSTDGDKQVVLDDLKYQLDQLAKTAEWDLGAPTFKVYAEREPCELCHNADIGLNDYQWTFYVFPHW